MPPKTTDTGSPELFSGLEIVVLISVLKFVIYSVIKIQKQCQPTINFVLVISCNLEMSNSLNASFVWSLPSAVLRDH